MAIGRSDETDLLLPLHDGVHERQPWRTFLLRLRQRVRADVAGILVKDIAGGTHWLGVPEGSEPLFDDEWLRQRPGRVYAGEGNGVARVVRVNVPDGGSGWLMIRRAGRDFTAADGALLGGLAPHFAVALRTRAVLDQRESEATAAAATLRRAGVGWVAFGADGRLLATSDQADAALGGRAALSGIASAVSACLASERPRVVSLGQNVPASLLLVPVAGDDRPTAPIRVVGLVRLSHDTDEAVQAAALAAMFGLARSEARLAVAIAGGASLAEAAGTLGLTIETARNYSKRVFAKTRTRGQVDLVRLIAGSVAGLA